MVDSYSDDAEDNTDYGNQVSVEEVVVGSYSRNTADKLQI